MKVLFALSGNEQKANSMISIIRKKYNQEYQDILTYKSVLFAMHVNRTRYMKCPKCNKRSLQKKVISKENNLSYHGCLFAFGNQMYFIEVNDDLKPSVVKDIYNNLCDVFRAGEVVLIFKSIIESRKRTLSKSDVRFIVKH